MALKSMAVGAFKQQCLREMENVKRTKHPLMVTKRGEPLVLVVPISKDLINKKWSNRLAHSGRILGDLLTPSSKLTRWKVLEK